MSNVFDSPDWSRLPPQSIVVANAGVTIAAADDATDWTYVGIGSIVTVALTPDASDKTATVYRIEFANDPLGNSVTRSVVCARTIGQTLVVPIVTHGPFMRIVVTAATAYPFTMVYEITDNDAPCDTVCALGPTATIAETRTVAAGATGLVVPAVVIPGEHDLYVSTALATWTIGYGILVGLSGYVTPVIATNAAPLPAPYRFIAPAASWRIALTNTTAGSGTFDIVCVRKP